MVLKSTTVVGNKAFAYTFNRTNVVLKLAGLDWPSWTGSAFNRTNVVLKFEGWSEKQKEGWAFNRTNVVLKWQLSSFLLLPLPF
mgnify:CR=1 FL=1